MNHIDMNFFNENKGKQADKVEDILLEDEMILVRLKPNIPSLIFESIFKMLPLVLVWLAIDLFIIITIITTGQLEEMIWFIIPFFAIHLAPVWIYIANLVRTRIGAKNIEYVFTDRRIIVRSGVIGIDFVSLMYADVVAVNCKVGITEKLFKVGDIAIQAKSSSTLLNNIPDPYFYLSKLQQIVLDLKSDVAFPNDLRPGANHGYKTSYNPDDSDK